MKKGGFLYYLFLSSFIAMAISVYLTLLLQIRNESQDEREEAYRKQEEIPSKNNDTQKEILSPLTDSYDLQTVGHIYQSFNNCGPATISMILSFYGTNVGQVELGQQMRPYQNPIGDNDDKSISVEEFIKYAKMYGFESIYRPNGTIEKLRYFVQNGIPVVVRTWLHPGEDIGHFRIVKGFDNTQRVIIQDDSYEGPNRKISYDEFISMWQPFNYGYILVFPKEKEEIVKAILGEEFEEDEAWKNALNRSDEDIGKGFSDVYPNFNKSVAYYYLKEFDKSTEAFETVENKLPPRMLWYQIEPIRSYQKAGDYNKAFVLIDNILNNNNRAFSELYQIRGEVYMQSQQLDLAKQEFEKAIFYNQNYSSAKESLEEVL